MPATCLGPQAAGDSTFKASERHSLSNCTVIVELRMYIHVLSLVELMFLDHVPFFSLRTFCLHSF